MNIFYRKNVIDHKDEAKKIRELLVICHHLSSLFII